jgi:monoamine oxidase
MNKSEAIATNVLTNYLTGEPDHRGQPVEPASARQYLAQQADRAHKALMAGPGAEDVERFWPEDEHAPVVTAAIVAELEWMAADAEAAAAGVGEIVSQPQQDVLTAHARLCRKRVAELRGEAVPAAT